MPYASFIFVLEFNSPVSNKSCKASQFGNHNFPGQTPRVGVPSSHFLPVSDNCP